MSYIYPSNLEELEKGDAYQIKYPLSKEWLDVKPFDNNMCFTKKETLKFLIKNKRLRIKK